VTNTPSQVGWVFEVHAFPVSTQEPVSQRFFVGCEAQSTFDCRESLEH